MKTPKTTQENVNVTPYIIGFGLAVILTLLAYEVTVNHRLSGAVLLGSIMGLAAVQLVVQLVFFLHLGREKGVRWNLAAFLFMLLILVIIVAGSLWIMYSLNYNMQMTPEQMNEFMIRESNKGF